MVFTPISVAEESGDFPDATTTGVQAGHTLTPVGPGLTISSSGVYEDLHITGESLVIEANNVTVRNCLIEHDSTAVVYVATGRTGVIIEYCDINGLEGTGVKGIWVDGAPGTIIRYCDISFSEDGIYFFSANNSEIRDNYIHSLITAGVDPHHDCLQFDGTGIVIDHNSLIGDVDANACLQFGNNNVEVTINNNLMRPGAALFPININDTGSVNDITITNNVIEEGTVGGSPASKYVTWNVNPPNVWTGNTDYDTGLTIPPPT